MSRFFFIILLVQTILSVFFGCKKAYTSDQSITHNEDPVISEYISNKDINCFAEDKYGYIWIGTNRGLNKYNGHEFHQYFNDITDSLTINNNNIQTLFNDSQDCLWVGTLNGVCKYNIVADNFERIPIQIKNFTPLQFIESKNKRIFVNIAEYLCEFIPKKNKFINVLKFGSGRFKNTCYIDNFDRLWVVSASYIKCYDITSFKLLKEIKTPVTKTKSYNSYLNKKGELWLIFDNILYRTDINKKDYTTIPPLVEKQKIHSNSEVSNIYPFSEKAILISTKMNGLYMYYTDKDMLYHESYKGSQYEVPEGRLNAVFIDSNDNLWVAPNDQGFLIAYKNKRQFNIYNSLIKLTREKSITAMAIDKNKNLWLSTPHNYKLVVSDLKELAVKYIDLKNVIDNKFLKDKINCIYIDSNNQIWFLIDSIAFKCKYVNGELQLLDKYFFPVNMTAIIEDEKGTVWIGGDSEYIYALKITDKNFEKLKLYDNGYATINDIILSGTGDILISSYNQKIKSISSDTWEIKDFFKTNHLKENIFIPSYLYKDSQKNIWLGTLNQGLYSYSINKNKLQKYDNVSFHREINSLIEDGKGHIWAGTGYGLIELNPKTESVASYYAYDGIGGNQFNKHAVCSLSDSILFFGGTHGLTILNTNQIKKGKKIPLYFENLTVNNKTQTPYNNLLISKNLLLEPKIKLKSSDNNIEIAYTALDFDKYHHLRYYYKMEGFDEDWIGGRYNRQATYSNLPAGNYVFKVKVTNNDSSIIVAENSISIAKQQIFWLTWPMIILYIIITISILAFLNYLYLKEKANREKTILAEKEIQHEVYINKMNMKFFTNMSHEFRTPLTMISGPISTLLKNNISGEEKNKLLLILDKSVKRMLKLLNQIMDFNKLEEDTLKLEKEKYDIIRTIHETIEIFVLNCKERNISFITEGLENLYIVSFDIDKLEKILENILSNALKFTPNKGTIKLSVKILQKEEVENSYNVHKIQKYAQYIQISIENTGSHIPEDKLENIFQRYYQIEDPILKNHTLGTGIGLYYTKQLVNLHDGYIKAENLPHEGVTFNFVIPDDQNITIPDLKSEKIFQHVIIGNDDSVNKINDNLPDHKNTILIVDDDLDISQYLNTILSSHYKVINSFDVKSAFDIINTTPPDIIISDIRMPGTDGYQFCQSLKNDITYSHIPVILLTAKSLVEEQTHGLNLGANAYVTKPFDPSYLLAVIQSQIENRDHIRNLIMNPPLNDHKTNNSLSTQDNNFLNNLYKVMSEELSNYELDMAQISEKMGISRAKFFYKVKGLTGTTPNNLFRNYKLNMAAEYLKEGLYNVSEIADMTGFKNLSYFSVSFKKQFGVSPSEYK